MAWGYGIFINHPKGLWHCFLRVRFLFLVTYYRGLDSIRANWADFHDSHHMDILYCTFSDDFREWKTVFRFLLTAVSSRKIPQSLKSQSLDVSIFRHLSDSCRLSDTSSLSVEVSVIYRPSSPDSVTWSGHRKAPVVSLPRGTFPGLRTCPTCVLSRLSCAL